MPALKESSANYARAVVLFDGPDAEELACARAQWKEVRELGFEASYWQQDEKGRWQKQA
jgi:DNA polymerase-3 subunit chi